MKLFKSLSRKERGTKRERRGTDVREDSKRARTSAIAEDDASGSGAAHTPPGSRIRPPGEASFITSSMRKTTARRADSNNADAEGMVPTNLTTRFAEENKRSSTSVDAGALTSPAVKMKRAGSRKLLDTIFSPMFSFFSSGGTRKPSRRLKSRRASAKELDISAPQAFGIEMTAIHSEIESIDDLEDKQVELLGGEQISAKEYLGRFGMTSEEALCVPYEEYDEEYDPWAFIYNLKFTPRSHISNGPSGPVLPEQEVKRNTLVLDLDETLVHSNLENTGEKCDFSFPVVFNNEVHQVNVKKRPHLSTFMEVVSKQYEIVVFTASQQVYADKLLDILDPKRTWIKHRVFRDSCVQIDGNFMKDLRVLGRDLSRTIIIDNSPQAFGLQIENAIPIESWYDDEKDNHLLSLLPILSQLATDTDVRSTLHRTFNLPERVRRGGLRSDAFRRATGISVGLSLPETFDA